MKKIIIIFILLLVIISKSMFVPSIDINEYPVYIDYGTLTQYEQIVFDKILLAVKAGNDRVDYDGDINCKKILTHLGLYYGSMENINGLIGWGDGYMFLYLDKFEELEKNKIIIDARVDEAIMNIKEGSERYKLLQISRYISNRIAYTDGYYGTINGLNGNGVCSAYAMLFYKMASRLCIQTYICYGYTSGEYHAWNMVVLDGKKYYYDITWYDTLPRIFWYLHSSSGWNRNYDLNNIYNTN